MKSKVKFLTEDEEFIDYSILKYTKCSICGISTTERKMIMVTIRYDDLEELFIKLVCDECVKLDDWKERVAIITELKHVL